MIMINESQHGDTMRNEVVWWLARELLLAEADHYTAALERHAGWLWSY